MILELDSGNSRIKWRLLEAGRRLVGGAVAIENAALEGLAQQLSNYPPPQRIRIVNVGGSATARTLSEWSLGQWSIRPEFAVSSPHAGGVSSGYRQPLELGADRWLALLATRAKYPDQAAIISDCGSAVTVDCIDTAGVHRGGYIAVGQSLLLKSAGNLSLLNPPASQTQPGISLIPADNTCEALQRGAFLQLAGFLQRAIAECLEALSQPSPVLLFTGGDAEILLPLLHLSDNLQVKLHPELVLDGLAVALP